MGSNLNLRFLVFCLVGFPVLMAYQNCTPTANTGSSSDAILSEGTSPSTGELDGNGSGYTGKITLTAPATIPDSGSYMVTIQGGSPPYQVESPQGEIRIVNSNGILYELENNFASSVNSFQLIVSDSEGNSASAQIDIIVADNVYNFSRPRSLKFSNGKMYLHDASMGKTIIFDRQIEEAIGLLHPEGNLVNEFTSEVVTIESTPQGVMVLDPGAKKLHLYDTNDQFLRVVDFASFPAMGNIQNIAFFNNRIHLVDGSNNLIHRLDVNGSYIDQLNLDFGSATPIQLQAIAADPTSNKLYVADRGAGIISVFKNGRVIDSFTSVRLSNGDIHQFVGLHMLKTGPQGELFLSDAVLSPNSGAPSNPNELGEQWILNINYQGLNATHTAATINFDYLDYYWIRTNCLDTFDDHVSFCDGNGHVRIDDFQGQNIEHIYWRLGNSGESVAEPQDISVADDGTVYLISQTKVIVKISSDYQQITHTDVYDSGQRIFSLNGLEVVGDRIYVGAPGESKVYVYDRNTMTQLFSFYTVDDNGRGFSGPKIAASKDYLVILSNRKGFVLFDFDGNPIKSIYSFANGDYQFTREIWPVAMDVTKDGLLFFNDQREKRIFKYDIEQDFLHKPLRKTSNENTVSLALSQAGDQVYFNIGNTIHMYSTDEQWTPLGTFGASGISPGTFSGIKDITLQGEYIYVCDFFNQRVQRITSSLLNLQQ